MKGQQLFHSFLPGVTAAVLTTQPSWAQTIDVGGIELFASPNVSTSTYSGNLIANDIKGQLPTALTPADMTMVSQQPLSSNSIGVVVTGKTGVPMGEIGQESRNAQSVLFSLTPTADSFDPITGIGKLGDVGDKGAGGAGGVNFYPAFPSPSPHLPSALRLYAKLKNPETQLPTVSEVPARGAGAAKLLQEQVLCSQGQRDNMIIFPACSQQNTISGNLVAQANTGTPRVPPTDLAPTTPATPATVPTRPRPGSPINPQVPTTTPSAPTNSTPIVPTTNPAPAGSSVQVPDYLNANPNPLQFPTRPEEVRIQGTQPITLAQALELARRNSQDLQVALLNLERQKYAVREAQAALYPTANLTARVTRSRNSQQEQNARGQLVDSPATSNFSSSAEVNYFLYTSGRRLASIRQAEEQQRFYELEVEKTSEDLRLNVTTDYYALQSADEQVRIYQASVLNYQASLRDAQALERAGVGTRFDVLQAQVNLANAQQQLTNAFAQQRIVRRQLSQRLSLPQSVDISAADPVQLAGLWNQTLEESIVLAFQNRPELAEQLAQRNIAEQQRRQALAQLGPQISLVGQYQLQEPFNQNIGLKDIYSLQVQASLNLFDGGAQRASADQARIQIRIADTQFATQRNTARLQVEDAYFRLQSNLLNVQTSTTALAQARESLRLARLRFQAGVGTQTDVINQEAFLTTAEGNRVTAILDYNRALAQLQRYVTSRGLR
ncbi:MAG: TolC family protein [Stigonema ocellatum SAG 48.90 = DSM 106950]|nr:TolC family protein [Stigonema ocellatum SAG 48.90 = DSM 106950]